MKIPRQWATGLTRDSSNACSMCIAAIIEPSHPSTASHLMESSATQHIPWIAFTVVSITIWVFMKLLLAVGRQQSAPALGGEGQQQSPESETVSAVEVVPMSEPSCDTRLGVVANDDCALTRFLKDDGANYDGLESSGRAAGDTTQPQALQPRACITDVPLVGGPAIHPRANEALSTNNRQLLGIAGAALLFLGVFMPIVKLPIVGDMNYFQNGKGDGIFVLVFAVGSLVLVLNRQYKGLWLPSIGSVAVLAFTFMNFHSKMSQMKAQMEVDLAGNPYRGLADLAVQSIQLQWGWAVLVIGVALLMAAAAMNEPSTQPASQYGTGVGGSG